LTFLGIPLRLSICRAAEYFANTGALKKAVEKRNLRANGRVAVSIVEAFGGDDVPPRDLEATLRLEYRSKLLNPKWAQAMVAQGAGGAFEVSQRMTAMVGWAATAEVDKFVFDGAAERYALDPEMAAALRRSNPEAFKNVLRRLLQNRFVTNRH
jgi:magnesium chelatase subunit H